MSNTVHVKKIEEGLEDVKNLGRYEETVEVDGHEITLRNLTPTEVEKAQEGAEDKKQKWLESESTFHMRQWIQKWKKYMLSYSIEQIDSADFHGVEYVQLDSENKVEKSMYLREEVIEGWSQDVIDKLFLKFRDVTQHAEDRIDQQLDIENASLDERIERLETKVDRLRQKKQEKKESEQALGPNLSSEEGLSEDELKEAIYGTEGVPEEGEDDNTSPVEHVQSESQSQSQSQPQSRPEEQQEQEIKYVDEDGVPLEGEKLEAMRKQDEMIRERQKKSPEGQTPSSSQNQPQVPQDPSEQVLTGKAAKEKINETAVDPDEVDPDDLNVAEGFAEKQVVGGTPDFDEETGEENEEPGLNEDPTHPTNPHFDGDV